MADTVPALSPGQWTSYVRNRDGAVVIGVIRDVIDLDAPTAGWPKPRHCRFVYKLEVPEAFSGTAWRTLCACRLRPARLEHASRPRLLFLDVDGVLTHPGTIANSRRFAGMPTMRKRAQLDDAAVARLATIIRHTGARIVVSSVWRKLPPAMAAIRGALRDAGFDRAELPRSGLRAMATTPTGLVTRDRHDRVAEIEAYLEDREYEAAVALDDAVLPDLAIPAVRTQWERGLQDEHVDEVIRCFTFWEARRGH